MAKRMPHRSHLWTSYILDRASVRVPAAQRVLFATFAREVARLSVGLQAAIAYEVNSHRRRRPVGFMPASALQCRLRRPIRVLHRAGHASATLDLFMEVDTLTCSSAIPSRCSRSEGVPLRDRRAPERGASRTFRSSSPSTVARRRSDTTRPRCAAVKMVA